MNEDKKLLMLAIILSALPILLLPLLKISGMFTYDYVNNISTIELHVVNPYYNSNTLFMLNHSYLNPGNCTIGYTFNGTTPTGDEYNMTFNGSHYLHYINFTNWGYILINVKCYNTTGGQIFNASDSPYNDTYILPDTNLSVSIQPVVLTYLNFTINATYYNSTQNISDANCTLVFNSSTYYMIYNSTLQVYQSTLYLTTNGTNNYSVTCNDTNHANLTSNSTKEVLSFFETITPTGMTAITFNTSQSSLIWADIDNDSLFDLIYSGRNINLIVKCMNVNGNFSSCSNTNIPVLREGSLTAIDNLNMNQLNLLLSGNTNATFSLNLYNNLTGNLTVNQSLTGIHQSSVSALDLFWDGKMDFIVSGTNNSDVTGANTYEYLNIQNYTRTSQQLIPLFFSSVYSYLQNNKWYIVTMGTMDAGDNGLTNVYSYQTQLVNLTTLTNLTQGSISVGLFNNDSIMDLVISGSSKANVVSQANTSFYIGEDNSYIFNNYLSPLYKTSSTVGDYNNDGLLDLLILGTQDDATGKTFFYRNNGTDLIFDTNYTIPGVVFGSAAFFDYDNDGDLDLAIAGRFNTKIYRSRMSNIRNNTPPSPPTNIDLSHDGTYLHIAWNNGTDDLTPQNQLYYNMRVGTTVGGNDIVSGKYGGSSNPTQGYFGNMFAEHSYYLNVSSSRTYYIQVQAIDAGLRAGNWSTVFTYDPCNYTTGDWVISGLSCTKTSQSFTVNGNIVFDNSSSLTLTNTNLTVTGSMYILNANITSTGSAINITNIIYLGNQSISVITASTINSSALELNSSQVYIRSSTINSTTSLTASNISIYDSNFTSAINNYGTNNTLINISYQSVTATSGNITVNYYISFNVTDADDQPLQDVVVNTNSSLHSYYQNTTSSLGISYFVMPYKLFNSTGQYNFTPYNLSFSGSRLVTQVINDWFFTDNSLLIPIQMEATEEPVFDEFSSSLTTNFSALSDFSSVSNAKLGITGSGQINFTSSINVSGLNLNQLVNISQNLISVGSIPGLNKSAILTMLSLSYMEIPAILANGNICTYCTNLSYISGTLIFNVSHFTNYTTVNNSIISVNYTNRTKTVAGDIVYFTAYYLNYSNNQSLSGTCYISMNGTDNLMSYDGTKYIYSTTFTDAGVRSYNISFNASCAAAGSERQNYTSSLLLKQDATLLEQKYEFVGLFEGASVVIDSNNSDIYLMGYNGSSDNLFYLRLNNNTFNLIELVPSMFDVGSISISDLYKESNYSITANGFIIGSAGKKILRKS